MHLVHGLQLRPIACLVPHTACRLRTGSAVVLGSLGVIVHLYKLGGVLRSIQTARHHQSNRLTQKIDPVARQQRKVRQGLQRQERIGRRHGERAQLRCVDDCQHVRTGAGSLQVQTAQSGTGIGAAYKHRVQHAGHLQVMHILPAPGQQAAVFDPGQTVWALICP